MIVQNLKKLRLSIVLASVLMLLFHGIVVVNAAPSSDIVRLYTTPADSAVMVGDTFSVQLRLKIETNSRVDQINANVLFTSSALSVSSISTSGSAFTPTTTPYFDNTKGSLQVREQGGAITKPTDILIATIIFRAKTSGMATISYASTSEVGTTTGSTIKNILTSTSGSRVSITNAVTAPAVNTPESSTPDETPTDSPTVPEYTSPAAVEALSNSQVIYDAPASDADQNIESNLEVENSQNDRADFTPQYIPPPSASSERSESNQKKIIYGVLIFIFLGLGTATFFAFRDDTKKSKDITNQLDKKTTIEPTSRISSMVVPTPLESIKHNTSSLTVNVAHNTPNSPSQTVPQDTSPLNPTIATGPIEPPVKIGPAEPIYRPMTASHVQNTKKPTIHQKITLPKTGAEAPAYAIKQPAKIIQPKSPQLSTGPRTLTPTHSASIKPVRPTTPPVHAKPAPVMVDPSLLDPNAEPLDMFTSGEERLRAEGL